MNPDERILPICVACEGMILAATPAQLTQALARVAQGVVERPTVEALTACGATVCGRLRAVLTDCKREDATLLLQEIEEGLL